MNPEQRIARALYEIERQRTSGEWNLCKVRDLLTGEEPAHLRGEEPIFVEDRVMCEAEPRVWLVEPPGYTCGALYTPSPEEAELLATKHVGGMSVRAAQ